jgi:hypothetical protein
VKCKNGHIERVGDSHEKPTEHKCGNYMRKEARGL